MQLRIQVKLRRREQRNAAAQQQSVLRQQSALQQHYTAACLRGSSIALVADHAECLQAKLEVDERLRAATKRYREVCANRNTRGVTLARHDFLELQQRMERLRQESQALQYRLGDLRRKQKEENRKISDNDFQHAARRVLSPEQFGQIIKAMNEEAV